MNSLIQQIILTFATGGGAAALFHWLANRRRANADGRSVEIKGELQIVDAALDIVEVMKTDITRLGHRVEHVETRNQSLMGKIEMLENENKALKARVEVLTRDKETLDRHVVTLTQDNAQMQSKCATLDQQVKRWRPRMPF